MARRGGRAHPGSRTQGVRGRRQERRKLKSGSWRTRADLEVCPTTLVTSGRSACRGRWQIDGGQRSQRTVVRLQVAADVLEMGACIVVHEVGVAVVLDADPQIVGQALASQLLRIHDSIK